MLLFTLANLAAAGLEFARNSERSSSRPSCSALAFYPADCCLAGDCRGLVPELDAYLEGSFLVCSTGANADPGYGSSMSRALPKKLLRNQHLHDCVAAAPRDRDGVMHVVGLSGGKDSTALALRLQELHPETPFVFLYTPTGDELPELEEHLARVEQRLGKPILRIWRVHADGRRMTLHSLIDFFKALPNHQKRWCTRMLKIEPANAFMQIAAMTGPVRLYVGLRADEEERKGLYSTRFPTVFPMREWGWGEPEVWSYLAKKRIPIPRRTDCSRCYEQRLVEWKVLSEQHPELYEAAIAQEDACGHTFRSPTRDKWPADLRSLREAFRSGRKLRGERGYREALERGEDVCRVCRL